ncbi:hypothetical protein EUX98_g5209 [Antrodiella citrinella]|uniref:Histone-lysine N-methyltransferase, H3 lysine-4 specific n=1 Tax=Antrodiella citrinella TaxID=2447956 RepID=A0A4S4MT38_9APHY|nr:hypothetical protein EUX98_g5209 [Antrodiella citrinella]
MTRPAQVRTKVNTTASASSKRCAPTSTSLRSAPTASAHRTSTKATFTPYSTTSTQISPGAGSDPPPPPPPPSEPRSTPPPPPPPDTRIKFKFTLPNTLSHPSILPPEPPNWPPSPPPADRPPSPPPSEPLSLPPPPPPPPPSSPPPRPASPPKLYSLPPPPPWPPARSEYPEGKDYKVLFDPYYDKDRDGKVRTLIELVRERVPERLRGKGKGKEILTRYGGEVVEGEPEVELRDPRKDSAVKKLPCARPPKTELVSLAKYDYDENSTGPAPPTAVLVMNVSPLSSNQNIRRYFQELGTIVSFEPQIDKANGGALGIIFIRYAYHEEAKRCVEKENGKKLKHGTLGYAISCVEGESLSVTFDGEGKILEAVMKELDAKRRQERERKHRKEKEEKLRETGASKGTPTTNHSASQTPVQSTTNPWRSNAPPTIPTGPSQSRVPTKPRAMVMHALPPVNGRVTVHKGKGGKQKEHDAVLEELSKNGHDHVTLDGQLGGAVRQDDVRQFFDGFNVDKVLQDHKGWYITFQKPDAARRAATVLNHSGRTLAHHTVNVTVHPPPAPPSASVKTSWTQSELVSEATKMILKDFTATLEKDIVDRVVGVEVRRVLAEDRDRRKKDSGDAAVVDGELHEHDVNQYEHKTTTLKGLTFRKQKRVREEAKADVEMVDARVESSAAVGEMEAPPKKKVKKTVVARKEDVESEDEVESAVVTEVVVTRKRATSVSESVAEPPLKKAKVQVIEEENKVHVSVKKTKKSSKKAEAAKKADDDVVKVLLDDLHFEQPAVAQVRVTPSYDSSPSPPISPVIVPKRVAPPRHTSPPPNPFVEGICEDDEDLFFAKLALSGESPEDSLPTPPQEPSESAESQGRKHQTGSARTEGYYKISHAEKSAYVAQYAARTTADEAVPEAEAPQPQNVTSSRSNRANARRRAQGLEEINQVQRAMALSKGESAATDAVKFNQLQTRKKHLRFARSPIHDWGLYAMEKISRGEMVIEYVGEVIRAQVADKREKAYERQGIGSSYLFRIDEDLVVDATKKGNLGRLINHSCDPNCTAKIITINGEKKIVIYAKQDIELGNEITYDYHFPIEQDKIPCLCGSVKCRGYLN